MLTAEYSQQARSQMPEEFTEDDLLELADTVGGASAGLFNQMLPRIVGGGVGTGQEGEEALAGGGFVLNECTVVLRLNAETDTVEFFCDVGLPLYHAQEAVYRKAMEMNLCRTYPGIVFGIHPESGRLVATTGTHALLMADDEVCLNTLQMLTRVVAQLRLSRTFELDDSA